MKSKQIVGVTPNHLKKSVAKQKQVYRLVIQTVGTTFVF